MSECTPYTIAIDDQQLTDLHQRLDAARWAESETPDDWSQGVPRDYLKSLCDYWRHEYDWRRCETMLNQWPQGMTNIDGLDIHYLHVRSPEPNALPLIITHGWPGSVIEFHKVIEPLLDVIAGPSVLLHGPAPQNQAFVIGLDNLDLAYSVLDPGEPLLVILTGRRLHVPYGG